MLDHSSLMSAFLDLNKKQNILDAKGNPIGGADNNKEELTLEASFVEAKRNTFKRNQVEIVEKLQSRLLESVESLADPYHLCYLVEAMHRGVALLDDIETIYPELE